MEEIKHVEVYKVIPSGLRFLAGGTLRNFENYNHYIQVLHEDTIGDDISKSFQRGIDVAVENPDDVLDAAGMALLKLGAALLGYRGGHFIRNEGLESLSSKYSEKEQAYLHKRKVLWEMSFNNVNQISVNSSGLATITTNQQVVILLKFKNEKNAKLWYNETVKTVPKFMSQALLK